MKRKFRSFHLVGGMWRRTGSRSSSIKKFLLFPFLLLLLRRRRRLWHTRFFPHKLIDYSPRPLELFISSPLEISKGVSFLPSLPPRRKLLCARKIKIATLFTDIRNSLLDLKMSSQRRRAPRESSRRTTETLIRDNGGSVTRADSARLLMILLARF